MIFTPLQHDSGKTKELLVAKDADIEKGEPLSFDGGYVKVAVNTETSAVRYVALEDVEWAATGDTILTVSTQGVEFEAECSAETAQTQAGTVVDLHTDSTLRNDLATGNIFCIAEPVGPAADKLVRGYFLDRVNV